MGKITAITRQKRNKERVNIFIDGSYAFSLAEITAAWLKVGQELSQEDINRLDADGIMGTTSTLTQGERIVMLLTY